MPEQLKTCTKCGLEKPVTEFHRDKASKDGFNWNCKACANEKVKRSRENIGNAVLTDRHNQYRRGVGKRTCKEVQDRFNRSIKGRYGQVKKSSKRRGWYEWMLFSEYRELVEGHVCHYCNKTLPPYGCGLDRKDNEVGYFFSNCVPCCDRCNQSKSSLFTYDEFRLHILPGILEVDRLRAAI